MIKKIILGPKNGRIYPYTFTMVKYLVAYREIQPTTKLGLFDRINRPKYGFNHILSRSSGSNKKDDLYANFNYDIQMFDEKRNAIRCCELLKSSYVELYMIEFIKTKPRKIRVRNTWLPDDIHLYGTDESGKNGIIGIEVSSEIYKFTSIDMEEIIYLD